MRKSARDFVSANLNAHHIPMFSAHIGMTTEAGSGAWYPGLPSTPGARMRTGDPVPSRPSWIWLPISRLRDGLPLPAASAADATTYVHREHLCARQRGPCLTARSRMHETHPAPTSACVGVCRLRLRLCACVSLETRERGRTRGMPMCCARTGRHIVCLRLKKSRSLAQCVGHSAAQVALLGPDRSGFKRQPRREGDSNPSTRA